MLHYVWKKIFSTMLLVSFTVGSASATVNNGLTDTQLHAVLGIVTNFILSDVDSDGDGVLDSQDAFPHDANETTDTDGDGIGNNADSDDDGDGALDVDEVAAGTDPLNPDDLTFVGKVYKVVTSPYTGYKWLDRNLGASQVCAEYNDANCYGDYYQWGRGADGHEDKNSATTSTQATATYTTDDKFIKGHADWVTDTSSDSKYPALRASNWSRRDGSSICPVGFRVPTFVELKTETIDNGVTNKETAFYNFLKVPSAGIRHYNANMLFVGTAGSFWSSMVDGSNSIHIDFGDTVGNGSDNRAFGLSIRCMKPIVTTDTPPIVTLLSPANIEMVQFGSYPVIHVVSVDDVDGVSIPSVVARDSQGQVLGSFINASVAGTYTLTYTATDSAGQTSNTVTVTITVHPAMKKTGQTVSYDENGDEVTDHSLKDDGEYQKGHAPLYVRDDGDNIVKDNITGLEWQDDAAAKTVTKQWLTDANYNDCHDNGNNCENTLGDTAATYCTALSLGGHEDWRVPTRKELVGLAEYGQTNPAMNPVFQNVASSNYWLSTTYAGDASDAWRVYFNYGGQHPYPKSASHYVRCVRAGQP